MSLTNRTRFIGAAIAGLLIGTGVARAQGNPPAGASPGPKMLIIDGERLPSVHGLLDSLRLGRFTVDSSVVPMRRRIAVENALGGAVFFPIDDNIQEIEVVKGPRAALFYGDSAANGVIIVTSKQRSVPRRT